MVNFYNSKVLLLFSFVLLFGSNTLAQNKHKPALPQKSVIIQPRKIVKENTKVSNDLLELQREFQGKPILQKETSGNLKSAKNPLIQVSNGYVVVDITVEEDIASVETALKKMGARPSAAYGRIISALVPIKSIDQLNTIPGIRYVQPAYKPLKRIGSVTSQGDRAQFSDSARTRFRVDGLGVKVGVLSDSYNDLDGAGDGIASGDLPGPGNPNGKTKPVQVLSDWDGFGSDEGRAMLEIIHDVAPNAELAFHTAVYGMAAFAQGILSLAAAGCDVIVDDIHYFAEPFFQDGIIAQAIDRVAEQGKIYFSAAGNSAQQSYESDYRPSNARLLAPYYPGTAHNFSAPGRAPQYLQPIYIRGGGFFICEFQWDEPFFSASTFGVGAKSDFDIFLLNQTGNVVAIGGQDNIHVTGDPRELIFFENPNPDSANTAQDVIFYLAIFKYAGPDPTRLKTVLYGDGEFYPTSVPIPGTYSSTVVGHPNAAGAMAIGAAFYRRTPGYGVDTARLEPFSSVGGTPIYYDTTGFRKESAEVRRKPEVVGPDGGNTSFFYADISQDADTFPNFFGTSASAPHVAGIAALMIEAHKNPLTSEQTRNALQKTAWDMDNPYTYGFDEGFDFASGYGFVNAVQAVEDVALTSNHVVAALKLSAMCPSNAEPNADTSSRVLLWKIHNPNAFRVKVNYRVSATTQRGTLIAFPGDTYFTTLLVDSLEGSKTVHITWRNERNEVKKDWSTLKPSTCGDKETTVAEQENKPTQPAILTVFPNPAFKQLRVQFKATEMNNVFLSLYNMQGEVVHSQYLATLKNNHEVTLDISQVPTGLYLLRMNNESGKQQTFKIQIKK